MNFKVSMLQAYLIAGSQDLPDQQLLPFLEKAFKAGVTLYQFREKGPGSVTDPKAYFELAQQARTLASQYQIPFMVDDDIDLALRLHADGVHVGQSDTPIQTTIQRSAGQLFIGYSCDTLAQVKEANTLPGIAYIGTGPVYPTVSKADADPVLGLRQTKALTAASQHPVVAIGGITVANAGEVLHTGVDGISGITIFTRSQDLSATVAQLLAQYPREDSI